MDSTPKPATPAYIGHYQLLEPIGRGGMGLVFRARDTRLEREVAIKCLRTELFRDSHAEFEDHYIERFKREALLLAKLNHPNIVQIYDFIEAPEQLALVMELVDGQNLQTYLREHIAPMSQRLHWLTQIAEGLAIAHDAGIIHRDLKAENILINKRGQAKITDLGIAKSQDFNATLTDHVAGSYCSMSPEQAMGENISFKSDLFSLGILAYQLLCGAHPFGDTGNKLQIMQRIISHPPTPPHKHNPELPGEFVDLLGQLLSKDPNKRPDNTHWVAAQFAKLSQLQFGTMTSDDTQVLAMPQPNTNNNGISRSARTQDHPTFETRFVAVAAPKISLWKKLKSYIAANKIVVSSATVSLVIITGVIVWQLQPKPPKYVAVIPPKLTAEGMQESQQELVKSAVYDAIQQSVIQLDGYYLIPHTEAINESDSYETIKRATAADELIVTNMKCTIDACTIKISLLTDENKHPHSKLIVKNSRTIDALVHDHLATATLVQTNVGVFFSKPLTNTFDNLTKNDYADFLTASQNYQKNGSSPNLLKKLESSSASIKKLSFFQNLYRSVALDLHFETKDTIYLEKLSELLDKNKPKNANSNQPYLINRYYLLVAKNNRQDAKTILEEIARTNASSSLINELNAYDQMVIKDYRSAINYYKEAIKAKPTAINLFYLANAYWYFGDTAASKEYAKHSLELSPNLYDTQHLIGLISLLEGNIEDAKLAFTNITGYKPDDASNLNNLGLCYLLQGNFTDATKHFERALKIAPLNVTYLLNKADAENLLGNIEESNATYQKVIYLLEQEHATKNWGALSQAYAHLGRFMEALSTLAILEQQDQQRAETYYAAALVHTLSANYTSAILNANKAISNGVHHIWFKFSWFDPLCKNQQFVSTMKNGGATNRCPP